MILLSDHLKVVSSFNMKKKKKRIKNREDSCKMFNFVNI